MSALDLFASAMGAFLLIAIMALPYYLKTDKALYSNNQELTQKLKECNQKKQKCEVQKKELEEKLGKCETQNRLLEEKTKTLTNELKQAFMVIVIKWGTKNHDIDMHLVDNRGNEYYFKNRTYAGSPAKLSFDTLFGPGVEVWEHPDAKSGEYKLYYNFYAHKNNIKSANVNGTIYFKNKSFTLKQITLSPYKINELVLVATIIVDNDGNISINQ